MKKSLYLAVLMTLLSTAFVACKSKNEGDETNESTTTTTEEMVTDSTTVSQNAVTDVKADAKQLSNDTIVYTEWTTFKTESQNMIDRNDKRIKELMDKIKKPGMPNLDKLREKRIEEIKERNAALRAKYMVYTTQTRAGWEAYKADFKKDLDALNQSIDDLNTPDKK